VLASFWTVAVPAALTFTAALIAAYLGYRQWSKQQAFERGKPFEEERREAYKGLWERLEAINVRLMEVKVRGEEFAEMVRALNTYVLANEIYFSPGIRSRVKEYYDAARVASDMAAAHPDTFVARKRGVTEAPELNPDEMSALAEALRSAEAAREAMRVEVRANIGG
jgi:hypothetical protein